MTIIGYHASHEQLPPRALLRFVQDAGRAGFDRLHHHHVGRDRTSFLQRAEAELLPRLREAS